MKTGFLELQDILDDSSSNPSSGFVSFYHDSNKALRMVLGDSVGTDITKGATGDTGATGDAGNPANFCRKTTLSVPFNGSAAVPEFQFIALPNRVYYCRILLRNQIPQIGDRIGWKMSLASDATTVAASERVYLASNTVTKRHGITLSDIQTAVEAARSQTGATQSRIDVLFVNGPTQTTVDFSGVTGTGGLGSGLDSTILAGSTMTLYSLGSV